MQYFAVSFNWWKRLSLSLFLLKLVTLGNIGQLFCRVPLFFWFLWWDSDSAFLTGTLHVLCSSRCVRRCYNRGVTIGVTVGATIGGVAVAQLLSCVWLFATPWITACQAPLSSTVSQSLLEFMSIKLVMPSNHFIFCHLLLLLPSNFPASGSFPVSRLCISWPEHWSFSFSNSPSNEYSGLIYFRIDWFDLVVQGTLKSVQQKVHKVSLFD